MYNKKAEFVNIKNLGGKENNFNEAETKPRTR